jgi:hypothetical protein
MDNIGLKLNFFRFEKIDLILKGRDFIFINLNFCVFRFKLIVKLIVQLRLFTVCFKQAVCFLKNHLLF